jgi:hypothetical protein
MYMSTMPGGEGVVYVLLAQRHYRRPCVRCQSKVHSGLSVVLAVIRRDRSS